MTDQEADLIIEANRPQLREALRGLVDNQAHLVKFQDGVSLILAQGAHARILEGTLRGIIDAMEAARSVRGKAVLQ